MIIITMMMKILHQVGEIHFFHQVIIYPSHDNNKIIPSCHPSSTTLFVPESPLSYQKPSLIKRQNVSSSPFEANKENSVLSFSSFTFDRNHNSNRTIISESP